MIGRLETFGRRKRDAEELASVGVEVAEHPPEGELDDLLRRRRGLRHWCGCDTESAAGEDNEAQYA